MAERIIGGIRGGSEYMRTALDAMRMLALEDPVQLLRWLVPAFPILQESAAHELWDEDLVDALSSAVVQQARDVGALVGLPQALVYRAGVHVLFGEFTTAATTHYGPVRYHSSWLRRASLISRPDRARRKSTGGTPMKVIESDDDVKVRFPAEVWPLVDVLHRGARRLTHNDADAEDLLQETLVRAFTGFRNFRPGTNLQAWLFRITTTSGSAPTGGRSAGPQKCCPM